MGGDSGTGGAPPNWPATPSDAEFRACMAPDGHEVVLRIKTDNGCTALTLTDDLLTCIQLSPEYGWCLSGANFYFDQPTICDSADGPDLHNPNEISTMVNGKVLVSADGRLDIAMAIDWAGLVTEGPPNISVSACQTNCEERDCRE
jgi:hypothetical protein